MRRTRRITRFGKWAIRSHAFDLDLLQAGKIIVRRSRQGETLKTLDGIDRKLAPEDLIIADANKPVALAGVMGGFDTMITDKTKNVLIESALGLIRLRFEKPPSVMDCIPTHRIVLSVERITQLRLWHVRW